MSSLQSRSKPAFCYFQKPQSAASLFQSSCMTKMISSTSFKVRPSTHFNLMRCTQKYKNRTGSTASPFNYLSGISLLDNQALLFYSALQAVVKHTHYSANLTKRESCREQSKTSSRSASLSSNSTTATWSTFRQSTLNSIT